LHGVVLSNQCYFLLWLYLLPKEFEQEISDTKLDFGSQKFPLFHPIPFPIHRTIIIDVEAFTFEVDKWL
jgi:hypothetical protein